VFGNSLRNPVRKLHRFLYDSTIIARCEIRSKTCALTAQLSSALLRRYFSLHSVPSRQGTRPRPHLAIRPVLRLALVDGCHFENLNPVDAKKGRMGPVLLA
jgi:hypothetical protein